MSGARGDAVVETIGNRHAASPRSLDFRDKTALERLVATSSLDPTLAGQRRSSAAKHLMRELVRRLDASMSCEVSHAGLAKALGCSVDTIERAQTFLIANGWLTVERRWVRGHQTCSRYHLLAGIKRLADRREPLAFWQSSNVVQLPERAEQSAELHQALPSNTTRKLPGSMTRKLRHDPVSPSEGETKKDPPSPSPLRVVERDDSHPTAGAGGFEIDSRIPESWLKACGKAFPACHKPHRHLAHLARGLGYTEQEGIAYLRFLDAKRGDPPRNDVAAVITCCGSDYRDPSAPAMGGAKRWLERRRKESVAAIHPDGAGVVAPIGRRQTATRQSRFIPSPEALAFFLPRREKQSTVRHPRAGSGSQTQHPVELL